jgi:hypothetical protein
MQETEDILRGNAHMLQDLHSGVAPRDAALVPQWHALRQAMERQAEATEKLTRALDKNTSSNYYRLGDPPRMEAITEDDLPPHELFHQQSWIERLSDWMLWDAAG